MVSGRKLRRWSRLVVCCRALLFFGLLGLLGSCGTQAKNKPVVVWIKKTFVPAADDYLEKGIIEIGKKIGIKVEVEVVSSSNLPERYSAAIEGNTLPDIGILEPYFIDDYHKLGLLQPLNTVVDYASTQGTVFPALLDLGDYQEGYFAIPVFSAGMVLYYRKDLLAAKGFDHAPKTWPELAEVARAVTGDGVYGLGFTLGLCDDADGHLRSGIWSYGGSLLDKSGNVTVNQPSTRAFLSLIKDLYDEGVIPPSSPSWDDSGNNTAYLSGQVAMVINTPSIYKATEQEGYENLHANTVLADIPGGPDGLLKTPGDTLYFGVFKNGNLEKAQQILKGFYQMDFYTGFVSQLAPAFVPVYQELREAPIWQDSNNRAVIDSVAIAAFPGYPGKVTQIAGDIFRARLLSKAVQAMVVNNLPVDQVLNDLEASLKESIKRSTS